MQSVILVSGFLSLTKAIKTFHLNELNFSKTSQRRYYWYSCCFSAQVSSDESETETSRSRSTVKVRCWNEPANATSVHSPVCVCRGFVCTSAHTCWNICCTASVHEAQISWWLIWCIFHRIRVGLRFSGSSGSRETSSKPSFRLPYMLRAAEITWEKPSAACFMCCSQRRN